MGRPATGPGHPHASQWGRASVSRERSPGVQPPFKAWIKGWSRGGQGVARGGATRLLRQCSGAGPARGHPQDRDPEDRANSECTGARARRVAPRSSEGFASARQGPEAPAHQIQPQPSCLSVRPPHPAEASGRPPLLPGSKVPQLRRQPLPPGKPDLSSSSDARAPGAR